MNGIVSAQWWPPASSACPSFPSSFLAFLTLLSLSFPRKESIFIQSLPSLQLALRLAMLAWNWSSADNWVPIYSTRGWAWWTESLGYDSRWWVYDSICKLVTAWANHSFPRSHWQEQVPISPSHSLRDRIAKTIWHRRLETGGYKGCIRLKISVRAWNVFDRYCLWDDFEPFSRQSQLTESM